MCDCHHDLVAISSATARLIDAIDDLLVAQGITCPSWQPLAHAHSYCTSFCQFYPTMTVRTLIGGLDVCTAALVARAEWETPQ